jgi:ABC-2 type transport system permease protein
MRGLLALTWLEIKIFAREPLGLIGAIVMPVGSYLVLGRVFRGSRSAEVTRIVSIDVPIFATILIALSAVLSLVTVVSIYRESGILKRLRATPLRPQTILSAQVLVKLLMSATTLAIMFLAGRRYYPVGVNVPAVSFTAALIFAVLSILSIGFLIASLVPTARFAQPVATLIFYPMIIVSGLFAPISALPPTLRAIARVLPLTYAVSLLKGIFTGESWLAHGGDIAALVITMAIFSALSARFFRWE